MVADPKSLTRARQNPFRDLRSKSGTRIIDLLVPIIFPKSAKRCCGDASADFGKGHQPRFEIRAAVSASAKKGMPSRDRWTRLLQNVLRRIGTVALVQVAMGIAIFREREC